MVCLCSSVSCHKVDKNVEDLQQATNRRVIVVRRQCYQRNLVLKSNTVKPVYNDHPRDPKSGRCSEVVATGRVRIFFFNKKTKKINQLWDIYVINICRTDGYLLIKFKPLEDLIRVFF